MIAVLLVMVALWLVFNLAAPYAVMLRAQPIGWGRLPAALLMSKRDRRVRFYMSELSGAYGYSVYSPLFLNLVVFDKNFFARATPALIRFVVAHELAHFHQGHHRWRWWAVVFGVALLPPVRRWLHRMEESADKEATERTGFTRRMFMGAL